MTRRGVRACRGRGDTEVPAKALALDVEAELRHVAVSHYVVLALDAHPPRGAGSGHRPGGDQVVVRDDLSLDEAALEVRVDDARGLRDGEPLADRPRARLLRPGGEERLQAESVEADPGQERQAGLILAVFGQQLAGVGLVQADQLRLQL